MENKTIKIFVVDAAPIWRKILSNYIESASDMELAGEINSSQGCIIMLDEVDPDVVMLEAKSDETMPLLEVVRQLKEIKPELYIILCADQKHMDDIISAMNQGAHDFITKPYKKHIVLRAIRSCLDSAL